MQNDDASDFITHTIARVDGMLAGEREHTQAQFRAQLHQGRQVTYKTGVVAPDGYAEQVTDLLCWDCDEDAVQEGYCAEHYAEHLHEREQDELFSSDAYMQWASELDEEDARWWLEHCPEHGTPLVDGWCAICVQEEQRNDR